MTVNLGPAILFSKYDSDTRIITFSPDEKISTLSIYKIIIILKDLNKKPKS